MEKLTLETKVKKEINDLVKHYGHCALFEFDGKQVRLLLHHWQYINPYKDAKRVNIAASKKPTGIKLTFDKYLYLYSQIK